MTVKNEVLLFRVSDDHNLRTELDCAVENPKTVLDVSLSFLFSSVYSISDFLLLEFVKSLYIQKPYYIIKTRIVKFMSYFANSSGTWVIRFIGFNWCLEKCDNDQNNSNVLGLYL